MGEIERYLRKVDLEALRAKLKPAESEAFEVPHA
jgi:hypothetical protein